MSQSIHSVSQVDKTYTSDLHMSSDDLSREDLGENEHQRQDRR